MARIHTSTTIELLDDGTYLVIADQFYEIDHIPLLFDRGAQSQAKKLGQQAAGAASAAEGQANIAREAVIPGLLRDVNNPQGFTPEQQNQMLVKQQEAAGGANAAIGGEGRLAALRSRTAGGIAPALAEAARSKGRTLATGALDVAGRNAELQQQKQAQARQQLLGLYGTDTSRMLQAMGLQSQDLQDQLAAGRQGWVQNATGVLSALQGAGAKNAAGAGFTV